ncbi:NUDIX hydrolase [Heyndrickxia acidiproducens]|uniref:NUDIX hydrolase n=1 Tax=Heyndrickxia acidiproducens TaxID=1121084 RepID=UPI0004760F44|nr:NUDIX hydrolase [Heyndrickxia acidiproducens]
MNWTDWIRNYETNFEQEKKDKEIILNCAGTFDDLLTRKNEIAHFTSSAFVVNKNRDKALMVHHNIFHAWSWPGGHADGDGNLLAVAMKEVREETGLIHVFSVTEEVVSLDILPVFGHIKKGKYVAPHLHFNAAFLLEADENEALAAKPDENSDVQWIPFEQIEACSNEPHMITIYKKIMAKLKKA